MLLFTVRPFSRGRFGSRVARTSEFQAGGKVARESDAKLADQPTDKGGHAHATMLDLRAMRLVSESAAAAE